jgi:hypothetical protein
MSCMPSIAGAKFMTLESMGFIHGHAARVIAVSSEESRRVYNAKTHNFPFLRAGRFREGFIGFAMSGRAKKEVTNRGQPIPCWIRPKISRSALSEILSMPFS